MKTEVHHVGYGRIEYEESFWSGKRIIKIDNRELTKKLFNIPEKYFTKSTPTLNVLYVIYEGNRSPFFVGCHCFIKRMVHGMLLSVVLLSLYYQSQIFSRFFLIFPLQIHIFVVANCHNVHSTHTTTNMTATCPVCSIKAEITKFVCFLFKS